MAIKISKQAAVEALQHLQHSAVEKLKAAIGYFRSRKVSATKPTQPYLQDMARKLSRELEHQPASRKRKIAHSPVSPQPTIRQSHSAPNLRPAKKQASPPLKRAASANFEGAGGHARTFVSLGSSHIAKRTSSDESNVYRNREKLGLNDVIAEHEPMGGKFVRSLPEADSASLSGLRSAASPEEEVLVLEKLGANIQNSQKRELDIKIGHSTASKAQLKESGHKTPLKKKIRMKVFDKLTKTDQRGYRFVGGKVHGQKVAGSRVKLGRATESTLTKVLDLPREHAKANLKKIIDNLENIYQTMAHAGVTFVDSSVLIMVDDQNPENTSVKMIDFGNPVYPDGSADFEKIKARYLAGLNSLIEELDTYYELYNITE